MADDRDYERAYRRVWREHQQAKPVRQEISFAKQVMEVVYDTRLGYLCFFTDDDILFRPVKSHLPLGDLLCFSLRLGANTTHCYPHNRDQALPTFTVRDGSPLPLALWVWPSHLTWDWREAELDFGYPASLDGHVMSRDIFAALIGGRMDWHNPNTLEDEMCAGLGPFRTDGLYLPMGSCLQSVLVGVPANQVTDTHQTNRVGGNQRQAAAALNDAFLAGARIDLDAMSDQFETIRGAHQELEYRFRHV